MSLLLKRLELQGFKSFADKTVLDFDKGVTAVVGPNGSGKSNISDAIRWVMGEMSAKTLRGSNMQDVIFAGTQVRKQLSYAEVSLVLDNSEHIFPVEFDEVVVTRRVFRSGETVYQINRANCRLKDIHELFMDTGLGRDGYSMIGQGSVAQILSTKAEDRRNIFEEAAGVSKYKYKKEEAARKLRSTDENLVRIADITQELESQLNPLKNQSEKARKYLVYYDEYKKLDINMSLISLDKNTDEKISADEAYKTVSDELGQMREQESEIESKISSLYEKSTALDNELREKNDHKSETTSRIMSNNNESALSERDIKNNEQALKRLESEILSSESAIVYKREDIARAGEDKLGKIAELEDCEHEFDKLKSGDEGIISEQKKAEEALDGARLRTLEITNSISAKRMQISGIDTLRSTYLARREALEDELRGFAEDMENTLETIKKNTASISEKKEKLEKINNIIESAVTEKNELELKSADLTDKLNQSKIEYNSKSSKYRMYSDMENEYEGYARSVKSILKSEELKKRAIYGTLANLIEVKKEYALAIETALGGAMQNIVVETEEDAKEAIGYLKREKLGRATFLPVSSVSARQFEFAKDVSKEAGFVGIGDSLISFSEKYRGIIESLLARVVIVDNIDNAIAISRKFGYKFKVVTLHGEVLNAGGSMSGGSSNKASGFLSRAADIKQLKADISSLTKHIQDLENKLGTVSAEISSVTSRIEVYAPNAREYENEIIRLENSIEHLKKSVDEGGNVEDVAKAELLEIEEKLNASSDETIEVLNEIRRLEAEEKSLDEDMQRYSDEIERFKRAREDQNSVITEYTLKIADLKRDVQEADNRVSLLERDILLLEEQIKSKNSEIEALGLKNIELRKTIEEASKQSLELNNLSAEIDKAILAIEAQKEKVVSDLKEIQSSNKELTDKLLTLQQELSRAEAKQARLEAERENILTRLWDDYELSFSDASQIREDIEDIAASKKRLAELKAQIKALGSVNMDSIEEYKAVSERYEFLSTQKADLEKSKDNLQKIIASMEELMCEHFRDRFSQINESFSIVFKELFGGGRGRLYLQEPDNILESGIEIEVQLPGKGLQNINLYSGGERSFIAIALLFAILRVKPAPFCILDEIDAALDDVNVARFATYLKNYLDNSQFIVITHRRGTMEAANILYGVTMQEKGISKLLSLQLDDAEEFGN